VVVKNTVKLDLVRSIFDTFFCMYLLHSLNVITYIGANYSLTVDILTVAKYFQDMNLIS
jgi:hypothetical protein